MTLYVSKEYYLTTFKGTIPESEVEEYLELAQEKIDSITFNKIIKVGFDNLTKFQKEKVTKAICYQADYIKENGAEPLNVSSYSVLDISITAGKETKASKLNMSERAYNLIHQTGLDCRIL